MDEPEEGLTAAKARAELPGKPAKQTLNGYLHKGVLNKHTGERVFLEFDQIGGRLMITRSQIRSFVANLRRREPLLQASGQGSEYPS